MLEVKLAQSWNYKGQKGTEVFFHTAVGSFMTAMRDWSPAYRAMVSEVLEPMVEDQFATSGHGNWARLSMATLRRKSMRFGAALGTLVGTGTLLRSFRHGSAFNVMEVTRETLRWGSSLIYSLFHQTGTGSGFQRTVKAPGPGVPMRKIIEPSDTNKRALRSILVDRLAEIARREGFAVTTNNDPLSARRVGQKLLGM